MVKITDLPYWNFVVAKPVFNDMRLSSLNVADEQINGGYRLQDFVSSQSGNYSGGKWIMHNSTKAREMFVTGYVFTGFS